MTLGGGVRTHATPGRSSGAASCTKFVAGRSDFLDRFGSGSQCREAICRETDEGLLFLISGPEADW